MPIPSPLHPRTAPLCTSLRWKDWAGFHAVCRYGDCHEPEYYALRHAAALTDVTPLFKYDVEGPDAAAFLSHLMVRDIGRLGIGRVTYLCWCDEAGKVLDDGTVWRLGDSKYRVTAADPSLAWFLSSARGFEVSIRDVTEELAALSLQGPRSRDILAAAVDGPIASLPFFRLTRVTVAGHEGIVTRTGYTGDLGYELWVPATAAVDAWDAIAETGRPYGLRPMGLDALDVARVEAGFIMNGVEYFSANHCLIDGRKSTPDELGLGWTVQLERDRFIGQDALRRERARGSASTLVGLEIDWDEYEGLYTHHGLPPSVSAEASRSPVPVYARRGRQVGYATTTAWSPLLKRTLALAHVAPAHTSVGNVVFIEVTVEFERCLVRAVVRDRPFFDPPRKRS